MRTRQKTRKSKKDSDNPIWTAEMFRRARPARDVLPEIYGEAIARKMLRPRERPKVQPLSRTK